MTSVDTEEGPDPNGVRRHARKMLTEREYRQRYCRLDFYRPNDKQMAWHNLVARERMLRAGNQVGKTMAAGAQMAMDALARYPDWYEGRQFLQPPERLERPYKFVGWAGCTTSAATRDGIQTKLLGDVRQDGGLGTGLIPLDAIVGRPTMARGIADFVDTITVRRDTGGNGIIRLKTFEMGRQAWQGEAVDEVWIDEDPGDDEIYGEAVARLTTTAGQIIVSMTPVIGLTPVRKRFKQKLPGTAEMLMTIDDAAVSRGGHIPDDQIPIIVAGYKESERQTRAYGADMQGEGAVFSAPVGAIKHSRDPATFPVYWPWLWGVDFRHSGSATSGHPFAAVLGAWDRDNDIIYIVHALRMLGLAPMHVAAICEHPMWEAPVAWPHDGGRGASIVDGKTIAQTYRARRGNGRPGLNMRPVHAQFPEGNFNFEAGITAVETRLVGGRLKVAAHLAEWFDEYQGYHRKDGLVVKVDDDLMSATRQLVMDIRFAKAPLEGVTFRRPVGVEGQLAVGLDFDLHAV